MFYWTHETQSRLDGSQRRRWRSRENEIEHHPVVVPRAKPRERGSTGANLACKTVEGHRAGSTVDIIPRIVFERLSSRLGQPIVVENRGGAGTTIGSTLVARSEAAVAALGLSPSVLVVNPDRAFKSAADLVAAAKVAPHRMNFSSVGVGSATHLSAERILASTGVQAVHVPFKGGAEAMTEVIAGRIDFIFGPVGLVLPQVKAGKLTALAVNIADRSTALPDVPTLRDVGFSDADYPFWIGLFVPTKTPREIVERLHRETLRALEEPKVRDRFVAASNSFGEIVNGSTPSGLRPAALTRMAIWPGPTRSKLDYPLNCCRWQRLCRCHMAAIVVRHSDIEISPQRPALNNLQMPPKKATHSVAATSSHRAVPLELDVTSNPLIMLEKAGAQVDHHFLSGGHELSQGDVNLAREWLQVQETALKAAS
jgi:tripartite-type tricarboxylate transporter receptor subunit TctC